MYTRKIVVITGDQLAHNYFINQLASSYNIVMELFKEYDEYGTVSHYYINGEGAKINETNTEY